MKTAYNAVVLGLATLCAGCGARPAYVHLPGDELPLLSLDEARDARLYTAGYGLPPYWHQGTVTDLAPPRNARRSDSARSHLDRPSTAAASPRDRPSTAAASPRERALSELQPNLAPAGPPNGDASNNAVAPRTAAPREPGQGGPQLACPIEDTACARRVSEFIADTSRRWLHERPTPADDISGARLFAFHELRLTLSCAELRLAIKEAGAVQAHFGGLVDSPILGATIRLRLQQMTRLAKAVGADLQAAHTARCQSTAGTPAQGAQGLAQD